MAGTGARGTRDVASRVLILVLLLLFGPVLVALVCVLVPVAVCMLLVVRMRLRWLIATQWKPKGIRYFVAYSDSEQWKDYFEREILPALGSSVFTINLSQEVGGENRKELGWLLFRHVGARRDRYPVVCRITRWGGWDVVRFYQSFLAAKKGRGDSLSHAKAELTQWICADALLSEVQSASL